MRVKRARKVRKYLRYYRTCHGFRAPYKARPPRVVRVVARIHSFLSRSRARLGGGAARRSATTTVAFARRRPARRRRRRLLLLLGVLLVLLLHRAPAAADARPLPCPRRAPIRSVQVLVDGNFLHAVSQMKLGHAKDVLAKYLGAPSKLFTTRCVAHELKSMGAEFKEASFAARRAEEVKGGPDPPTPAFDSVVAAVAGDNAERFIVCTQDEKLRRKLMSDSAHVPVVFCHTSGLQMEPPSDATGGGVASQARSIHWSPYDLVGVVNADP